MNRFGKNLTEMLEAAATDLGLTIKDEPDYEAIDTLFGIDVLNRQADSITNAEDRRKFALGHFDQRLKKIIDNNKTLDSLFDSIFSSSFNNIGERNALDSIFEEPKDDFVFMREETSREIWAGSNGIDTGIIYFDDGVYRTFTTSSQITNRENAFDSYEDALEYFNGKSEKKA